MLDMNLIRTNPDLVRENIKKKFQDAKLPLVDEVIELDKLNREAIQRADYLRSQRNTISKQIGMLMGKGQKEEAEAAKAQVKAMQDELAELEKKELTTTAGGGAVEVTINGNKEITKLIIDKDVVDPDDVEMLQDLVMAAVNEAIRQIEELEESEMNSITGGFGGMGGGLGGFGF